MAITNTELLNAIEILQKKVDSKSSCVSEDCPAFIKVNTKIKVFIALIVVLISIATFNFTLLEAFKKDVKIDIKVIEKNLNCYSINSSKTNTEIKNVTDDIKELKKFYSKIYKLSDVIDKIIEKSGDM